MINDIINEEKEYRVRSRYGGENKVWKIFWRSYLGSIGYMGLGMFRFYL